MIDEESVACVVCDHRELWEGESAETAFALGAALVGRIFVQTRGGVVVSACEKHRSAFVALLEDVATPRPEPVQ